jgi:PAS domain-containing protein
MGPWFEVGAFRVGDAAERTFSILFTDITQRRRTEEALREAQERFRTVTDTAPAMLWVTEPDGSCSFLSRGWFEFTGQTEASVLASDGSMRYLQIMVVDDKHDSALTLAMMLELMGTKRKPLITGAKHWLPPNDITQIRFCSTSACQASAGMRWRRSCGNSNGRRRSF